MINTKRLIDLFDPPVYIRQGEWVNAREPKTFDDLPSEWKAKTGWYQFPDWNLIEIEDVHLCGPAMVGIKDNDVVLDVGYYGRLDLWERNAPYYRMAMSSMEKPAQEIDTAISLCSCWSGNYFHWVLDDLPKLEAIQYYEDIPTILAPINVSFVDDSLAKWFDEMEIIKVPFDFNHYHVKRLLVPTSRRQQGRIAPSAMQYLRSLALNEPEAYTSKCVYISRKLARTRRVVNENKLLEALLKHGFSVIQGEILDIHEQVQRFAHVDWVIAPHGAGLANLAWCNYPGVKVIELATPAYNNPCCWLMGEAIGANYGLVMCEPSGEEDMTVDVDKVIRLMYAMEQTSATVKSVSQLP